ncbi:MAG: hypothetical protein WAV16_02280 [Candidatus Moraniibacteriota bacterium]
MKKKEQGKIALVALKEDLRKNGLHLRPIKKKGFKKKAAVLGISTKKAKEFAEIIVREMVDEIFPPKGKKK